MKVTFVNEPTIKPVGNGDGWMLCDDFFVRVDSEDAGDPPVTFTVPMGSTTDLASVPRLPGAYLLFGGRARRSAILHDWLYESRFPRKWADDVFRAAMKEEEINPVTRFVMWLGVRVGGASYYQEVAQDSPDDLYKN